MKKLLVILLLTLSASAYAEDTALLHVSQDQIGKPLLFGSRIVTVNRPWGKVFSDGQRNARPVVVHFEFNTDSSMLMLRPHHADPNNPYTPRGGKQTMHPLSFRIVSEVDGQFLVDVLPAFATYPKPASAIPVKMLPGPAERHSILDVKETPRYYEITGRYVYSDGLDVTASCYLLFLRETPLAARPVNPELAGFNCIDIRMRGGGRRLLPHHWVLQPGSRIDFYVDRDFPADWYPYIKEGLEDWNKAFRAIGLGDVLAAHPEPEGLDRNSPLVNMVRYMDVEESNAKGDVLVDPRSGEILQADVLWWKNVTQLLKDWRYVQTGAADPQARRTEYPMEMMGPLIRHAICHEVGHILGLSHNMGASWAYPSDSLRSPSFTREYGTCASVMDYARYNHLATAADVQAGVNLLPPRLGPYDYYAIACMYWPGVKEPEPGPYCYFAPFISAAISPDPSAQAETLGNDLLLSSRRGLENCRALLGLDGLTPERQELLSRQYYRYLSLALSNIGGTVKGVPVTRKLRRQTLAFVMASLQNVPPELLDSGQQQRILDELTGNFLPERLLRTAGEKELRNYYAHLRCLHCKYPGLPLKDAREWILNH